MTERKTGMVRLRNGFSDRNEIASLNRTMQIEEFDDDTRTLMYNKLCHLIDGTFKSIDKHPKLWDSRLGDIKQSFCGDILENVFLEKSRPNPSFDTTLAQIKNAITKATYNEVLDIIEYSANWFESRIILINGQFYTDMNQLFEQEYVGYRFVNGIIVAITDKGEIEAIENACKNPYEGCQAHIEKALGFLADRKNKDYKNSIKESISAVESICEIIVNEKTTLSDALKKLENAGKVIHPSLKQAFQKLYAYTSDQGGIRHADGMFESNVTFEEAEFMLVACSAFVNYLIAEYGKGGK